MESDQTPEASTNIDAQGDTNLTQPSGEQPTSVQQWFDNSENPVSLEDLEALEKLVAEERRQAKIECLEDLLLAEDIGQGDVSTWNKVIRSRITEFEGRRK